MYSWMVYSQGVALRTVIIIAALTSLIAARMIK
jgi:hypothetical protein